MGYFDNLRQKLGGGQGQANVQPPAQGQPGGPNPSRTDPNQQQSSQLPGNGSQATGNPQMPLDPMAAYQDLYTSTNNENTTEVPSFKLDSEKLNGVVGAQDFLKGIDPAAMQKIQSGDLSGLSDIIQHATRNAYRAALEHGSTLTDKFVDARFTHEGKGLGNKIREQNVNDSLASIPGYSNPVAQQELVRVAKLLASKHPDATPAEIAAEARRYITTLGENLNPNSEASKKQKQKAAEVDWDSYMSDTSQDY